MKRRSFLALLGLAPAALALPSVASAVPEAVCSPSAVNDAVRALMADYGLDGMQAERVVQQMCDSIHLSSYPRGFAS